jgi:hypothetical protein
MARQVTIPFLPEFEQAMVAGDKTLTSRTKWYADKGDWFVAFGHAFIITKLFRANLWLVKNTLWQQEGCESPEHFEAIWRKIHPRAKFQPEKTLCCHEFTLQRNLAQFHLHQFDYRGRCEICGYEITDLEVD